ncbi:MAG TPA: PIN domain-containing protein, partial [Firmicutes bacterium]|nr:PIN domain-containing protein [Bacillota bacterium]
MTVNILLDTNVLVYAYDRAAAAKWEQAVEILDRAVRERQTAISSQVLGEFVLVVSRKIQKPLKGE